MNRTRLKYYLRALGTGIIVTALLMGYSQKGQSQMTDEEILQRAAELGMAQQQGVQPELDREQGVLADLTTAVPESTEDPVASDRTTPTAEPTATPTAEPDSVLEQTPESDSALEQTLGSGSSSEQTPESDFASEQTPEPGSALEQSPEPSPTLEPEPSPSPTVEPVPDIVAEPEPAPAEPVVIPPVEPAADPTPLPAVGSDSVSAGDVATLVVIRGEDSGTVSKKLEELGLVEDYKAYDRYLCDNGYAHSICVGTYEIPLGTSGEEIARIICKSH